jgi:hypothetical protein
MAIAASDLVLYHASNNVDADTGTQGGAIDTLRRPDFTQMAANDTIEAVSSNAGDTMNVTVTARKADGTIATETKALTGTTAISFSTLGTVERILHVELASAPTGSVTVRRTTGPTTVRVIPAGERGFSMPFRKCASDPSASRDYYSKVFWRNAHGSLALTSAQVEEAADADARITFTLAASKGDSATTTNRLTVPGTADTDPDTFDGAAKNVPTGSLGSGEQIGVWLKFSLPAADAPHKYSYQLRLSGQSV